MLKAYLPILSTELPKDKSVNPLHSEKAYAPIVVTEFGIETETNPVHLRKQKSGIVLTLSPIMIWFSFTQSPNTDVLSHAPQ